MTTICPNCGARFPASGAKFCPVCGQPLPAPASVPMPPQGYDQRPSYRQPQGYGPVPAYPGGPGSAPARGRRSSVPLIAGLVLVVLVIGFAAGATFVLVAGGSHASPGSSVVGAATPTATPAATPGSTEASPSAAPSSAPTGATSGTFTLTGPMSTPRSQPTATLLPDGRVLMAGGLAAPAGPDGLHVLASAELYDPATGTFSPTGSMTTVRYRHTATVLADGRVLVAGGADSTGQYIASAELYDPTAGTFSPTGTMTMFRADHTATLLPDGQVLIAGGMGGPPGLEYLPTLAPAELYDPTTGTFSATGSTRAGRSSQTATLLSDGRVLIVGGADTVAGELYDPNTGTFGPAGSMTYFPNSDFSATLMSDGRVLIAGGLGGGAVASAELYRP